MNSFLETNESSLSVGREERIQNSLLIYEQTYIRRMGLSVGLAYPKTNFGWAYPADW